ncbi:hypothetical protein [Solilutibacter pythonis]|uniref:hypothetical protein n=1 Tax=Solilutibacter pythonis TaxID=2483112 RepID=UPI001313EECE|nr:hypothetical protein [Lysobacter pythonis]
MAGMVAGLPLGYKLASILLKRQFASADTPGNRKGAFAAVVALSLPVLTVSYYSGLISAIYVYIFSIPLVMSGVSENVVGAFVNVWLFSVSAFFSMAGTIVSFLVGVGIASALSKKRP